MGQLSALFIGGTGTISSACVTVALDRGIELTVLNRGRTTERPLPRDVRKIDADIRDPGAVRAALGHREFDAVVDFVAFSPSHVDFDVELFTGRTGQYVFVSSASAYHKPVPRLPIVESTPLHNPYWGYSRAKISCEERLHSAYLDRGFRSPSFGPPTPTIASLYRSSAAGRHWSGRGGGSRLWCTVTGRRCGS